MNVSEPALESQNTIGSNRLPPKPRLRIYVGNGPAVELLPVFDSQLQPINNLWVGFAYRSRSGKWQVPFYTTEHICNRADKHGWKVRIVE